MQPEMARRSTCTVSCTFQAHVHNTHVQGFLLLCFFFLFTFIATQGSYCYQALATLSCNVQLLDDDNEMGTFKKTDVCCLVIRKTCTFLLWKPVKLYCEIQGTSTL